MRFKATALLAVVVLVLAGYLYWVELPGTHKADQKKRLFSFSSDAVTRLAIHAADGSVIEMAHHVSSPDEPWQITHPIETVANAGAASSFASELATIEITRVVEEKPADLSVYGLTSPAYKVIITVGEADTHLLEIGDENLTKGDVYARGGEGSPVYLVPASVKQVVGRGLKDWRRQEVLNFSFVAVDRIQRESEGVTLELVKEGEAWAIKRPIQFAADPSEVDRFLGRLSSLKGDDFIDDNKEEKKKEMGPPLLTLSLGVGAVPQEVSFYPLKGEPEAVYAVTTPKAPIFKLSRKGFEFLTQAASSFKDRRVLLLKETSPIEEIRIERPSEKIHLIKKDKIWRLGSNKVISKERIERLLSDLQNMRVATFLEGKPGRKIDTPAVTLYLIAKGGKLIGEMAFGEIEGEKVHSQSSYHPSAFYLRKEDLDLIPHEKDLEKDLTGSVGREMPPEG